MALTDEQEEWLMRLRVQREELQAQKRNLRARIRVEVEDRARIQIAAQEQEFADRLKEAVLAGMPVTLILRDVLKTNSWATWVKWRDLAGLDSMREIRKQQKGQVTDNG